MSGSSFQRKWIVARADSWLDEEVCKPRKKRTRTLKLRSENYGEPIAHACYKWQRQPSYVLWLFSDDLKRSFGVMCCSTRPIFHKLVWKWNKLHLCVFWRKEPKYNFGTLEVEVKYLFNLITWTNFGVRCFGNTGMNWTLDAGLPTSVKKGLYILLRDLGKIFDGAVHCSIHRIWINLKQAINQK